MSIWHANFRAGFRVWDDKEDKYVTKMRNTLLSASADNFSEAQIAIFNQAQASGLVGVSMADILPKKAAVTTG